AEAYLRAGNNGEAQLWIDRGFDLVNNRHERGMESEFLRLQGELHSAAGDDEAAEDYFQRAVQVAQTQRAKSWELRALMSFGQLRQRQDRQDEVQEMLRNVYNWFTEGADTADLVRAAAMLDA
ncbi:MAG: hypothetical protein HKN47_05425, partial [Pirellulaceae bacterium]|nr:hypothetical protein [Pirellulaceae bacterium]